MSRHQKKTPTGKKHSRGADLVIHGEIKSKRDPFLQQRIDMVVEAALKQKSDHSTDVINSFHHVAHASLKACRVG